MKESLHGNVQIVNRIFDMIDSLDGDPNAVEILLSSAIILHLENGGTRETFEEFSLELFERLKDFRELMDS